jgi:hypothetical protein
VPSHAGAALRCPAPRGLALTIGVLLLALLAASAGGGAPRSASVGAPTARPIVLAGPAAGAATTVAMGPGGIALGTSVTPSTICADGGTSCPAEAPTARVTLSAAATNASDWWPNVQIAFVVETTSYDGVYDPSAYDAGNDVCGKASPGVATLCEESNGVPFFVANAGLIAHDIAANNPHSNVSFAMVDYFATFSAWDDGDGSEYHVDVPQFISADQFGPAVVTNFQDPLLEGGYVYSDSDLGDNQLFSSSITALYGTIVGSGLNWSKDTHHVIVWMGSTAPRDPNYPLDLCVSPQNQGDANGCAAPTCEPSYKFASLASPRCEGWVRSQDGSPNDSIAALTKSAPTCTDSVGQSCTVDVLDDWDTPTDGYSSGWPTAAALGNQTGEDVTGIAGPGAVGPLADAARILTAGCDLASATGGTWDGPTYWACPGGTTGRLQYVDHGSAAQPDTLNPTLLTALRHIGFGPVVFERVAFATKSPLFTYVSPANFALASDPNLVVRCVTPNGSRADCPTDPTVRFVGAGAELGWNWSADPRLNVLLVGDAWSASFTIVNTGPPEGLVPVLECATIPCAAVGADGVGRPYSAATYQLANTTGTVAPSFPLAEVRVEPTPAVAPPTLVPPNAPPLGPATPVPVASATATGSGAVSALGQGVAPLAFPAIAAGLLAAGFSRAAVRQRAVAQAVATPVRAGGSRFDPEGVAPDDRFGRDG